MKAARGVEPIAVVAMDADLDAELTGTAVDCLGR